MVAGSKQRTLIRKNIHDEMSSIIMVFVHACLQISHCQSDGKLRMSGWLQNANGCSTEAAKPSAY